MVIMNPNEFISIEKSSLLIVVLGTVLLIILQGLGESSITLLRYENSMAQTGEWWRLLSGNFVHLGWAHLVMNLAALWILVFIFQQVVKPIILLACLPLGLGISLGMLMFTPDVTWSVGLSGMLHGFVVMGALVLYRSRPVFASILLICVTLKILWEQFFADAYTMEAMIGGKVIYDGHLYGAITGVIITAVLVLTSYARAKKQEK